jgi:hypothetical protein
MRLLHCVAVICEADTQVLPRGIVTLAPGVPHAAVKAAWRAVASFVTPSQTALKGGAVTSNDGVPPPVITVPAVRELVPRFALPAEVAPTGTVRL